MGTQNQPHGVYRSNALAGITCSSGAWRNSNRPLARGSRNAVTTSARKTNRNTQGKPEEADHKDSSDVCKTCFFKKQYGNSLAIYVCLFAFLFYSISGKATTLDDKQIRIKQTTPLIPT